MAGAIKKADTKNIAKTATACGNKDGKRERKESVVVIRGKLLRERGDWGQSFNSSKSTYSPSLESSGLTWELPPFEEEGEDGGRWPPNRPERPPTVRSNQRQMNHTAMMYAKVRSKPNNICSGYLLRYKLRSLYTFLKNGSRRLGMKRMASPVDFISGPNSLLTLGNFS